MGKKKEIVRVEKWRDAYSSVIDDLYLKPFVWGKNDCAVGLVGKVITAITGEDLVSDFVGKYDSAQSGFRLVKSMGYNTLVELVADILPECHVSESNVGDIAAVKTDDMLQYALGVVNGERILVLTPDGIGSVDLFEGERFFKVG